MSTSPWPVTRFVILGAVALAVLLGGFGTWSAMSTIAGAVIASGQVEVEANRQVVQHPDGGVVAAIHVVEGEPVAAGQLLMRLDDTLLRSELAIIEGRLHELMARRGRLLAERDEAEQIAFPDELLAAAASAPVAELLEGQQGLFDARRETTAQFVSQLEQRRAQIGNQIDGIAAQRAALTRQLELIGEELESQQSLLDRGLAQAARVLSLQREAARLEGARGQLAADAAQAEEQITEISTQIISLRAQRREDAHAGLRDLGAEETELRERRAALHERLDRLDIRAPVAGVVLGLQVTTPRAVLRAAEPALYVVPQDRPLLIAARIDPSDIDHVHVGQEATLTFTTFGTRDMPDLLGRVTMVSADVFTDDRTAAAYYRAELVLEPEALALLDGRQLLPGMPVEAFMRTRDRTPFDYLTRPLTDYFARAFRED